MNPINNYSIIDTINPNTIDALRLIMFSDKDKSINTRDKDEKKLNIKSFTKMCLCLERKQDPI